MQTRFFSPQIVIVVDLRQNRKEILRILKYNDFFILWWQLTLCLYQEKCNKRGKVWVTIFRDLDYKKVIILPPTVTSNHRHNWWVYAWHFSLRLDNRIVMYGVPAQALWALVQLLIKYNRAPHIRPSRNWALARTQEKSNNQRG